MPPPSCLLPLAPLTALVTEAFHEVLAQLGTGFGEIVYQRSLAIALRSRGLLAETEYPLSVLFGGQRVGLFEADLIVERLVLVEVKATPVIEDWAKAQILNYLKCAGGGVGLLINFGRKPEVRRFVMGNPHDSLPLLSKEPAGNPARWYAPEEEDPASKHRVTRVHRGFHGG